MPYTENDIIAGEFKQEYLAESMVTTLAWKVFLWTVGADEQEIFDAVASVIIDAIRNVQLTVLDHLEQIFSNLTDGISQTTSGLIRPGLVVDPLASASFFASGMKKNGSTRITRPGGIRLAGLGEGDMAGNDLSAGQLTRLVVMGASLTAPVDVMDVSLKRVILTPVIVGRDPLGAYDLLRINLVTGYSNPVLTTQNSRKPGR